MSSESSNNLFIGIIVRSVSNTLCHHRFELDVSEEIRNITLKCTVPTETMVVGCFICNTNCKKALESNKKSIVRLD